MNEEGKFFIQNFDWILKVMKNTQVLSFCVDLPKRILSLSLSLTGCNVARSGDFALES